MPTNDLDQVIEQLGITADEIKKNADKFNMSAKEAIAYTVVSRARTPSLPKNPRELDAGLNKNNPDSGIDNMRKVGMRYSNTPRDVEAATSGVGGAIAGGLGGMALGPGGAVAGALGGSGMGAAMSYIMNALTNSPGEAFSANRVLDLAGPAVGGAIGKLPKLGATAKALTNTAADTLMAYMADAEDNKRSGTDGKNPLGRAAVTAGMGGVLSGITRQGARQKANVDLADELDRRFDTSGKPESLQDLIYAKADYVPKEPVKLFGADEKPIIMRDKTPSLPKGSLGNAEVKKFLTERPEDVYNYTMRPITEAKTQEDLKRAAPVLLNRVKMLGQLAGDKEKDTVMAGLKNEFIKSISLSEDGSRVINPDSFGMRVSAMGPQLVDEMLGKDSYAKLSMLSQSASKAGALGRFSIKMGDGYMLVSKMIPLDEDANLTKKALDIGKVASLASVPLSGKKGMAAAAAIQAYETYKIPIDTLLNKTDKKTLAALSSGLLNSTSNSVVNKLTEWFEKNADEKTRVPLEEPPKLF